MEEKKELVENSGIAIKGTVNGMLGSMLYEVIIYLLICFIVMMAVAAKNAEVTPEQLSALNDNALNAFPYGNLASCLGGVVTIGVFIYLIKWNKFKELAKKAINLKTIRYGVIGAIIIMSFSIIYNMSIMFIFNLSEAGNANQQGVIESINSGLILGGISAVIIAPLVEELTYRYCLFGGLFKKKRWLAYLVSGLVFMFMHSIASFSTYGWSKEMLLQTLYLPPYLFAGLALCYLYDKSNNLGSSIIAHSLNNLVPTLAVVISAFGL